MSSIESVKASSFQAQEMKRHNSELQKLRDKNALEFKKEVKANEELMGRIRSDYETKVQLLERDSDHGLAELRRKHQASMQEESYRLNQELEMLRGAQKDKLKELKEGNEFEINRTQESHKKSLDLAREKFLKEKIKYES
jgi:hypothetical protein